MECSEESAINPGSKNLDFFFLKRFQNSAEPQERTDLREQIREKGGGGL